MFPWPWRGGNSSQQQHWTSTTFPVIKNIIIKKPEIGRGACGVVFNAEYEGTICAAKEIHSSLITESTISNTVVESFIKEINILSRLRHPNIVYFLGVYHKEQSDMPVLVMEKMWTSLDALVSEEVAISDVIKIKILKDVVCGLVYLHSQSPPMVHRDLTSTNVLLNENLNAKIADLGLARVLETITKVQLTTAPGTIAFMPPEALHHNPEYTTKLDVFSFGCVILHAVTQEFPEPTNAHEPTEKDKRVFSKVPEVDRRKIYLNKMMDYPCLPDLVSNCLKNEPKDRPESKQIHESIEQCLKKIMSKQDGQSVSEDKLSLINRVEGWKLKYRTQEQELLNFKNKISNQQATIDAQKSQISKLTSQQGKFHQDMSQQSTSDIVINLNEMLQQGEEDLKEKEKEIESWKTKLNTLEKAMITLRKKSKEKEQGLSSETQELIASLRSKDNEKAALQKAYDQQQSLLKKKELEISQLKSKSENMEQETSPPSSMQQLQANTNGQQEISQLNNRIKELEKKMTKSEKEKEELQKQLNHKISVMEEKVKTENKALRKTEEALKSKEKAFKELQKECEKLKQKNTEEQQGYDQLKDEIKNLEESVSKITNEKEQLQKHDHKISEMVKKLNAECEKYKQEITQHSNNEIEITANLKKAEKAIENKEKVLLELQGENLRLSSLLDTNSSDHNTTQQTEEVRKKPGSHMSNEGTMSQKYQKAYSKLYRKYQKLKQKYSEIEQENYLLNSDIQSYLDQLSDSFKDVDEKEEIVQIMMDRQKKLRKHLQTANRRRLSSSITKPPPPGAYNSLQSTDSESFTGDGLCFDSPTITSAECQKDCDSDDDDDSINDEEFNVAVPQACESNDSD